MSTLSSGIPSTEPVDRPAVAIDLRTPPEVINQGHSLHGVGRLTDEFQLPELWSLHLYSYAAELQVDGVTYPITPGSVSLVPPASVITYSYRGPSRHLYAHLQADIDTATAGPGRRLDVVMSPGAELPMLTDLMESAVSSAAARPERTRADIWMFLLRLADRPLREHSSASPAHEHVAAAMSYIEGRLSEPVTVPQIAQAVGITHNHLTRIFAAHTQQTVIGYLRHRRIEHAQHLLHSSTMSIAAIAATVGIPDLQAFNKTCRAVTGSSPRQLRQAAHAAARS